MKQIFLLFLFCATAHGQNNTFPIDVRVLVLGSAAQIPERYLSTEEGYKKITFSNRQASQIIKAYRSESLPVFKKATNPNAEDSFGIAEQVKFPQGSKSVLLLCWRLPTGELDYFAISDSILVAGYNDWLMVNTTSKAVGLRIGQNGKPVLLEPNGIKKHQITAEKGSGVPVVGVEFYGEKKKFYSTYWKIRENERSIIIFTEQGNKIKVTKIGDRLLQKEDIANSVR